MDKVAVFMSGKGSNALNLVEKSRTDEFSYEVGLILQYGAKVKKLPESVKNQHRIEGDLKTFEKMARALLRSHDIGLIALAGFTKVLSADFIREWRGRIINIHPSLLPRYAGMIGEEIHKAVLANGDKETGVTVHWADEEVDTGEILEQYRTPLLEGESLESLTEWMRYLEHLIYPRVVDELVKGLAEADMKKSVDLPAEAVYSGR